jgi:hypothetical protein
MKSVIEKRMDKNDFNSINLSSSVYHKVNKAIAGYIESGKHMTVTAKFDVDKPSKMKVCVLCLHGKNWIISDYDQKTDEDVVEVMAEFIDGIGSATQKDFDDVINYLKAQP